MITEEQLAKNYSEEILSQNFGTFEKLDLDKVSSILKKFECFTAYIKLMEYLISKKFSYPILWSIIKIYTKQLDQFENAANFYLLFFKMHSLNIEDLLNYAFEDELLKPNEWVLLLEKIASQLTEDPKIKCLEALALFYEKKVFNIQKLNQTYKEIISKDPKNKNALRYFKNYYLQSEDYKHCIQVMEKLIECSENSTQKNRIRAELASLYLFKLDQPQAALNTLCLDDKEIKEIPYRMIIESYAKLKEFKNAIKYIQLRIQSFTSESETSKEEKSSLYLEMGLYYLKLEGYNNLLKAKECFLEAIKFQNTNLKAIEELLKFEIKDQNNEKIMSLLENILKVPELFGKESNLEHLKDKIKLLLN